MRSRVLVTVLAAPFALSVIACGVDSSSDSGSSGAAPAVTKTTAGQKPSGPQSTIAADGTYLVGTDIKAGTWRVRVSPDAADCYWEREKSTDGGMDSILANDNVSAGGQAVVTIKASDAAFKTAGCGTWTRIP